MGLLSILGAIGAPFTGGLSLGLGALDALGNVAGGAAQGRAKGRADQAQFNLQSGLAQQGANVGSSDANIRQQEAMARLRAQSIGEALRGTALQHTGDASITGTPYGVNPPQISGGLRPSMLGGQDERYKLGTMVRDRAVNSLASPWTPNQITPQNFSGLAPKPGGLDKFLNVLGSVGAVSGAMSPFYGQDQQDPYKQLAYYGGGHDENG